MPTSQTAVFRRIVADHMAPPPLAVASAVPAVEAVSRMRELRASAAVVLDDASHLTGIVTEQDVVRRFEGGVQPVTAIMSAPVLTVRTDDHLYQAVGFMRRHRLRHMPVVDGQGAVVGMLELHEALAVAAGPMVEDIDRLTHEDSMAGLAEVKSAISAWISGAGTLSASSRSASHFCASMVNASWPINCVPGSPRRQPATGPSRC